MSIIERLRDLVEPSPDIRDPTERRRARILTSLLLACVPLGWATIVPQVLLVRGFVPTFVSNGVALLLLMACALLARTRFYRQAAGASMVIVVGACASAGILRAHDPVWWSYELIAVLLATLLLSLRGAALIALLALASVLGVGLWHGATPAELVPRLMFHVLVSPLLLLVAHHRNQLEEDRRGETLAHERQLEEARLHACENQRLETVGRIAGGVAHDFNNLLTVVLTSSSLARTSPQSDREGHLDAIDAASRRGTLLVRQLLAYARKQVLEVDRLELGSVVSELEPILERLAGKDVLRIKAESDEPLPVRADRSQLEQVLVNLVVNARDAIGEHGTVEVRTGLVSNGPAGTGLEDTPCAYLVVADDGSGMNEETRKRIFEPFFTTKSDRGGTGLGLSTVYGVVLQSGGQIEVESATGEGTTFRIYLPLADRSEGLASSRPESRTARRGKLLVIDDEELVLRTTVRMLRRSGYDVIPARGPAEARARWAEHQAEIGVVLSDVVMPGTDGLDLVKELTKDAPDVRVVLMSGFSAETLAKHERSELPLLEKPFSQEALIEAVCGPSAS